MSQRRLSRELTRRGVAGLYPATIAKIESGARAVQVDELRALADIFGITTDTLIGRRSDNTDLAWAMGKLTSSAQKIAIEVHGLHDKLEREAQDVRMAMRETAGQTRALLDAVTEARSALLTAEDCLISLAGEFPLPGVSLERAESTPAS